MTILSSFLATIRQRRVAIQSIIASIPLFIYFRDEYFSVTYVRGTSMEPTLHHGDVIILRKRDAGSILLQFLHNVGYIKSSSKETGNKSKFNTLKDGESNPVSTRTDYVKDNDRALAIKYRLEDNDDNCSFISSSMPIILPGHVVVYRNPYQFREYLVKRVIGIGGQRIATFTSTPTSGIRIQQQQQQQRLDCENKEISSQIDNTLPYTANNIEDTVSSSSSSSSPDDSFSLEYIRLRRQQEQDDCNYYNFRLPPYFYYTEGDNANASINDSRHEQQNRPISQSLLVGIAEYVLWPPSRLQRIARQPGYETVIDNNKSNNRIPRPRATWDK